MDDDDDLVGTVGPPPIKPQPHEHVPTDMTRTSVIAWTASAIPQGAMATLLMIDETTLRKHYRNELDNGLSLANGMVVNKLFAKCAEGDMTALIFWTKARMGWRDRREYDEKSPLVIKSGDSAPVDPRALARELRDALMELRQVTPALPPP